MPLFRELDRRVYLLANKAKVQEALPQIPELAPHLNFSHLSRDVGFEGKTHLPGDWEDGTFMPVPNPHWFENMNVFRSLIEQRCDETAVKRKGKRKRPAHRPPDTDATADTMIGDAWLHGRNSGQFVAYRDLANELKRDETEVREAIDRDRHRRPDVWRQRRKPRRKK